MNRRTLLAQLQQSPIIPLVWYLVVSAVMYTLMGGPILVLIVPFGGVYGAWLWWGWRHPIQTTPTFERLYLVLFGWQLVHLLEELTTGFYRAFPALWGQVWNGDPAHYSVWGVVAFIDGNLALDFFWVVAFLLLPLRSAWANYAFYTLLAGMAINAVQHPIYALYLWGHPHLQTYLHTTQQLDYTWYFPGLFTAFGHAVLSFVMIRYLVHTHRQGNDALRPRPNDGATRGKLDTRPPDSEATALDSLSVVPVTSGVPTDMSIP